MATSRRFELAKLIGAQLRLREGRNLVAVGLYGSVARGEDRAHSDVDLLVVVREKRLTISQLVRTGILVTILQQTRAEVSDDDMVFRGDVNVANVGWRCISRRT